MTANSKGDLLRAVLEVQEKGSQAKVEEESRAEETGLKTASRCHRLEPQTMD